MSNSQGYEKVTVASDGVTVTKRFEEDEFPVPAIAFEFTSERDEDVTVVLSDEVPDGVAVEDLGFHPEYGSEYWTIDDDSITFERELSANSQYTTVYGIRATGADDVEQFLTQPVIERVDPPLEGEEGEEGEESADGDEVVPSDDDVVKDVISGEGEVPGLEDEDENSEQQDEEIETLDLKDPNDPEATQPTGDTDTESESDGESDGESDAETDTESEGEGESDAGDEGDGDDVAAEPADVDVDVDGSIIGAMAQEIRTNDVAVDDLKLLQRAFVKLAEHTGGQADGTTEARIQSLQSDIADLRAYTDALEEFLEENGTAQQLFDEFEVQLQEVSENIDAMESELESNSAAIEEIDESVDGIREEVENVGEEVDGVSEEVDDVSEEVDDVGEHVEDVEQSLEDLRDTVEYLEDEVSEGEVMGRIEDLETEIDNLQEWQDQIKSTFGG